MPHVTKLIAQGAAKARMQVALRKRLKSMERSANPLSRRVVAKAQEILQKIGNKNVTPNQIALEVGDAVVRQMPNPSTFEGKKFFKNANQALSNRAVTTSNLCVDRCNAAIALLKAIGVKAWAVRQVDSSFLRSRPWMHDYVEFVSGPHEVSTLVFHSNGEAVWFDINKGSANEIYGSGNVFSFYTYLRGADSENIGGVKGVKSMHRFTARFEKGVYSNSSLPEKSNEISKNKRRIELLKKREIIPEWFNPKII